jgi:Rrf2 family protein
LLPFIEEADYSETRQAVKSRPKQKSPARACRAGSWKRQVSTFPAPGTNFWGVKLSAKSDYAARAALALARRYPSGKAYKVEALAASEGVPANYLVQILLSLKAADIVQSQRGKEGGYLLAKAPAEITLGDVLCAMEGQVFDTPTLADPRCPPELRAAWSVLRQRLEQGAHAISLQDLLDQATEKVKMYYI